MNDGRQGLGKTSAKLEKGTDAHFDALVRPLGEARARSEPPMPPVRCVINIWTRGSREVNSSQTTAGRVPPGCCLSIGREDKEAKIYCLKIFSEDIRPDIIVINRTTTTNFKRSVRMNGKSPIAID